jgi:excisionase family DNA binding protein
MRNTAAVDPDDLDPLVKPFQAPRNLARLGFGDPKTVYAAIANGEIPVVRVGRKILVPTAWVRRAMALDDPRPAA